MLEYELYLPLHYNDGRPIDPEKLKNLKKRLVDEFGGLTHFRQENEGLWKIGDHTFRDRVEIVRVLASDEVSAQKYFAQLKSDLTRDWNQQDFLIVSRAVTEMRVTIPRQWVPAVLNWNGVPLEKLESPGCRLLTIEKALQRAAACPEQ